MRVRTFEEEDRDRVDELRSQAFANNRFLADFEWRHLAPPVSTALWVAEVDDEVVGFLGYVMRPLQLGRGLEVLSFTGGDAVIDETQRGKGIGKRLMQEARRRTVTAQSGAALGWVWANRGLASGLYRPAFGYHEVPRTTVTVAKLLSWDFLGLEAWVPDRRDTTFAVELDGLPLLGVAMGRRGIRYSIEPQPRPAITLRVDPRLLASGAPSRTGRLVRGLRAAGGGWLRPAPLASGTVLVLRRRKRILQALQPIRRALTS